MPPRAKYTQDEIIDAAFGILRTEGRDAITARHLGDVLGGSSRPIFTVFGSMRDVQEGAVSRAKDLYNSYLDRGLAETPPFKGAGMEHIRFASDEPLLFREIFMQPGNAGWGGPGLFLQSNANYTRILEALAGFYGLSEEAARHLYEHLWIYTHGIASLYATGVAEKDMDTASRQLTEIFSSLLPRYRSGDLQ